MVRLIFLVLVASTNCRLVAEPLEAVGMKPEYCVHAPGIRIRIRNVTDSTQFCLLSVQTRHPRGDWETCHEDVTRDDPYSPAVAAQPIPSRGERTVTWNIHRRQFVRPLTPGEYRFVAFVSAGGSGPPKPHVLWAFRLDAGACQK